MAVGGGNIGRNPYRTRGFQGAPAGAENVKAKPQIGSGGININKLRDVQAKKKTGIENYKLNPNGVSRIRLVMPFGGDDIPLHSADAHWIPAFNDDGKEIKRMVYCYKQFGFRDCPICALRDLLMNARDASLEADAEQFRMSSKWACYVINRDYLIDVDDPIAAYNPRQEKVILFNGMTNKVADDIIKVLTSKAWGDASDPTNGYDFEITGEQTGKTFNNYKISDYTVSPMPRDSSPAYDPNIVRGMKPLSQVIKYMQRNELQKLMSPNLIAFQQSSEEGAEIVEKFMPYYNDLLDQINAGPDSDAYYDEQEQADDGLPEPTPFDVDQGFDGPASGEREQIEVQESDDEDAEVEEAQDGDEDSPTEPDDSEDGEPDDGEGEGPEEAGRPTASVSRPVAKAKPMSQPTPKPTPLNRPVGTANPLSRPKGAVPSRTGGGKTTAGAELLGNLRDVTSGKK